MDRHIKGKIDSNRYNDFIRTKKHNKDSKSMNIEGHYKFLAKKGHQSTY